MKYIVVVTHEADNTNSRNIKKEYEKALEKQYIHYNDIKILCIMEGV